MYTRRMQRIFRDSSTRPLSLLALILTLSASALSQTAQIAGTITDSTGARVPDANLAVRGVSTVAWVDPP